MKLCFVGSAKSIHVQRWVRWFAERGHDVHLISPHHKEIEGVKIHKIGKREGGFTNFIRKMFQTRKLIHKIKPDILHAHYVCGYGTFAAFANYHPFVVSVWGSDIAVDPEKSKIFKVMIKFTLKSADVIHVQDPLSKRRLRELKAEENKIRVIPWGIDLTTFSPQAQSEEWKRKLRKKSGPVIIIIIRGDEKRYASTVAKAIPTVLKEKHNVNFLLVKSKEVQKLGLKDGEFIDFIPYSQMPFYMANADIFVDPYYPKHPNEIGHTYGMALLEAMACGTPTIAANRPTISKLKGEDKWYYGYTFEGGNPEDLAKHIIKLLSDKEEKRNISKRNRESVERKFDMKENMGKIENIYKRLLRS